MTKKMPLVSIVGRPNVGKSSLFNRIIGRRHAVVEEREGTTRDRIEAPLKVKGKNFILSDTGGFLPHEKDEIRLLVKTQVEKAIFSSDVLLFVCDGEKGPASMDSDLAGRLRKAGKRIILVINKIDNDRRKENITDFYELGLGEPLPVSCLHNLGIEELLNEVMAAIPAYSEADIEKQNPIKIAVSGKPNVGKSSFLNRVLDDERVIVHEKPGTTRDSIDIYFKKDGIEFLLIDTAGIRHKRKVKEAVDVHSMMRAMRSIDRSDITILLVDGMDGVTNDDVKIFDYIKKGGKGLVIAVNKWDLVKDIEMARYRDAVIKRIPEARNFPVAFISAKTGRNVPDAFNLVKAIKTNLDLFIDAASLNDFLKGINPEGVSVSRGRKHPRFYRMAQIKGSPKRFLVFVNDPRAVTIFHTAFIENRLRENFPLNGVPLSITYKRLRRTKDA